MLAEGAPLTGEKREEGPDELSRSPSVMSPKKNGSFVTVFPEPVDPLLQQLILNEF